jgi:hypothetical protein
MDQAPPAKKLVKLMIIGDGKIGKTHYAGEAARAGFNVLYLNGDVATQTLATLDKEIQKRIYLMEMGDIINGGMRDPKFIRIMKEFTSQITLRWNDRTQEPAKRSDKSDEVWEIKPGKLDENVVLVIDSWTSLVESMAQEAAIANGLDLATASTSQMRNVYQSTGARGTAILQIIRSIACHVILICHPDEYQHKTAPEGKRIQDIKETEMIVDWTKMIPKSSSRPHGMLMSKYLTDVAWMEISPSGKERRLNFTLRQDRISGGHFDGVKSVEEYSFANLVKQIGGSIPDGNQDIEHWLKIIPAGEMVEAAPQILDGTQTTEVKAPGLSGLFKGG